MRSSAGWAGPSGRRSAPTTKPPRGMSASTLGGLTPCCRAVMWTRPAGSREGILHLEYHDPFGILKCSHALLAGVAYYLGDQGGRRRGDRALPGDDWRRAGSIPNGRMWFVARRGSRSCGGDPPRAQRLLLECAEGYIGAPVWAVQLYHEAMRVGRAVATCPPAAGGAARGVRRAAWSQAYADDAAARALGGRRGRARPVRTSSKPSARSRHASECAAAAAEIFAQAGRQDSARRAAARSRELHGRCQGGLPHPRCADSNPTALSLTEPGEAAGRSWRRRVCPTLEIADQPRARRYAPSSPHLYRAMQKLG